MNNKQVHKFVKWNTSWSTKNARIVCIVYIYILYNVKLEESDEEAIFPVTCLLSLSPPLQQLRTMHSFIVSFDRLSIQAYLPKRSNPWWFQLDLLNWFPFSDIQKYIRWTNSKYKDKCMHVSLYHTLCKGPFAEHVACKIQVRNGDWQKETPSIWYTKKYKSKLTSEQTHRKELYMHCV